MTKLSNIVITTKGLLKVGDLVSVNDLCGMKAQIFADKSIEIFAERRMEHIYEVLSGDKKDRPNIYALEVDETVNRFRVTRKSNWLYILALMDDSKKIIEIYNPPVSTMSIRALTN